MLTNRLGDILLIVWVINCLINQKLSIIFLELNILLIIACITKSAQSPFSAWLPQAIRAPTPVRTLVHRSTLVTAGLWILISHFKRLRTECLSVTIFLGVSTILVAGLISLIEIDAKRLVALSTLSQLGFIIMSIGLGLPTFALCHLLIHACLKASLFIRVGRWIHSLFSNQDIRFITINSYNIVRNNITTLGALIGLCGISFIGTFVRKEMILESRLNSQIIFLLLIVVYGRVSFTSAYCLRLGEILVKYNVTPFFNQSVRKNIILNPFILIFFGLILGIWLEINVYIFYSSVLDTSKFIILASIIFGWNFWLMSYSLSGITQRIIGLEYLPSIISFNSTNTLNNESWFNWMNNYLLSYLKIVYGLLTYNINNSIWFWWILIMLFIIFLPR